MVWKLLMLLAISLTLIVGLRAQSYQQRCDESIGAYLKEIQTLKIGMTRADVERLFTREGGFRGGTLRASGQFFYTKCPYIKLTVQFEPGGGGSKELPQDKIVSMSQPFLEATIATD